MNDTKKCPHCGSEDGLYSKETVSYLQYYDYEGNANGYSEFSMTGSSAKRKSIPLYCCKCDRFVKRIKWE